MLWFFSGNDNMVQQENGGHLESGVQSIYKQKRRSQTK